jgi:hypothetical protein
MAFYRQISTRAAGKNIRAETKKDFFLFIARASQFFLYSPRGEFDFFFEARSKRNTLNMSTAVSSPTHAEM